ncbi:AbrB/MazE/SpoVT family DNA-binding domain-containing protein [Candidatus Peregrinibacteria bacterium]|nr:AbrB/MazE/SpoVT family DNA-binding domain-containing protein [Candidatus Peregrinibacteria bacterium]
MTPTKIVRPQAKGMITIPVEFREKLAIDENSLLEASMMDNGVMFTKINYNKQEPEVYSDKQIKKWLKKDTLDLKTAKKLKILLK